MSEHDAAVPQSVYLYGTCLVDMFYPEVGMASIELLRREGVQVIFPPDQSCCGQPAWNAGYREQAMDVIRAQLDLFPKQIPIIVPSASCAGMMKLNWSKAFADEQEHQLAMSIAKRVIELTDFLVNHLHIHPRRLARPEKVAVHNSCSSLRQLPVAGNIERLLGDMGAELCIQRQQVECCGFGGTFCVKQADISGSMVADKCAALVDCGADLVVSQDCGCLMNIGNALKHQQGGPRVKHIAEYLLESEDA